MGERKNKMNAERVTAIMRKHECVCVRERERENNNSLRKTLIRVEDHSVVSLARAD